MAHDRHAPANAGVGAAKTAASSTGVETARSLLAYLALAAGLAPVSAHLSLLGAPLVLLSILAGWHDLRRISRILLLLVALSGTAAAIWSPQMLAAASGNTARLSALVIAVMLLSATLGASRDVGALAGGLFIGRPLPRYLGVTFATGFLAIPLNFGSVGVMSTLIGREIAQRGDTPVTRNAARAVLRGFALSSISSPLSISVAITLTFLPQLRAWELISVSLPFAMGYMFLGAAFREPENPRVLPPVEEASILAGPRDKPLLPWLRFSAYISAICIGAFLLSSVGGVAYSRAVAVSCVTAVAAVLLFRRLASPGAADAGVTGPAAGLPSMAHIGNELAIMSGSAFLGVLASSAGLQWLGHGVDLPGWAYPLAAFLVPWLLFLGGMLGLNPIVTGTLAGAMLSPLWPTPALLGLGVGIVSGWGLTVAGTPYSANSLLLSRLTGYDAHVAALRWNLALSVGALSLAGMLGAGLTYAMRTAA